MYHRTFRKINLDAIEHNFDALSARLGKNTKKCVVIKADAYGHGALRTALKLQDKADYFAVASIDEAKEIRYVGIKTPILVLTYTHPSEYGELIENNITATVYSLSDAKKLSEKALKNGKRATVHIKVDTGMNRVGFSDTAVSADEIKEICGLEGLFVEGVFSHYAKADEADKTSAGEQTQRFDAFIGELEKRGINIPIKHICNSAGIIDLDCHYDMVRMGIGVYGIYPSDEVEKARVDLIPAMEVISHVTHVKDVEKGEGIGYGLAYTAKEKRKIATVAIGYADGFNRSLSNKGYVLIAGKKAPITGKVCMDQIMVDVTEIENVTVGDEVVILGKSGDEEITAEDFGRMCDSFSYEVICTFMPRVEKIY